MVRARGVVWTLCESLQVGHGLMARVTWGEWWWWCCGEAIFTANEGVSDMKVMMLLDDGWKGVKS